jgi:4-hydroxy 2-oxovalerate aldolase/long-chain acyl-CoA synthetase
MNTYYFTSANKSKNKITEVLSDNYLVNSNIKISWKYIDYVYISYSCYSPNSMDLLNAYFGKKIYNAVRSKSKSIRIGFHGHNNLGMAVANNLKCVELGFDIVDCSFQGLGRSIGNTSTEMFVMALKKKYGEKILNMDIPCLLEYGYITLKEITNKDLYNPLDLVCGYTGFHSSFLKEIYKCCIEFEIDPLRLIIEYTKHNKVSLDHQLLEKIAKQLPKDKVDEHPYSFKKYFSNEYNS